MQAAATSEFALQVRDLTVRYVDGRLKKLAGHSAWLQRVITGRLSDSGPQAGDAWLSVKTAVDGLSLEVPHGAVFGFLGQNGAGKTTTIKVLTGLLSASGGGAWINGVECTDKRSRLQLGYMPENPYFYEYLKPLEMLDFYGRLYGMPRNERMQRSRRLLDSFGLGEAAGRAVRGFSKGMRQRLGLAQAVLPGPKLVVLDEPMSGLDPGGRNEVKDVIRRLAADGTTVFFSTHILSDVADLCDWICLIDGGHKVAEGKPDALLDPAIQHVELDIRSSDSQLLGKIQYSLSQDPEASRVNQDDDIMRMTLFKAEQAQEILRWCAASASTEVIRYLPKKESLEEYFLRMIKKPMSTSQK